MLIRRPPDVKESEITPRSVYISRRQFLYAAGALAATGPAFSMQSWEDVDSYPAPQWLRGKVQQRGAWDGDTDEKPTPYKYAAQYNNFYEFGTGKGDPHENAKNFVTDPWSVAISGAVSEPKALMLEDLLRPHRLQERIYRLRCVEAWSMVIPWIGLPLADLVKQVQPLGKAKYVAFTTLHDPEQMPGQRSFFKAIDYPYREGLRLDEAMHPLTLLAVGMYGDTLPPQNGAPFRLVVPWKYGFKSIKSIVRIHFTETQPETTWQKTAPREYGFYANVNPEVSHPRWSQANERRLPSSLFASNRIKTRPFNGYADQVAHLYAGMDLRTHY